MRAGQQLLGKKELGSVYDALAGYVRQKVVQHDPSGVLVLGMKRDGDLMVPHLRERLNGDVRYGSIDFTLYRDDAGELHIPKGPVELPTAVYPVDGQHVILLDSVLRTGRSTFAALKALHDMGRPASVELAVLLNRRGHEMPIVPQFQIWNENGENYQKDPIPEDLVAKLTEDGLRMVLRRRS